MRKNAVALAIRDVSLKCAKNSQVRFRVSPLSNNDGSRVKLGSPDAITGLLTDLNFENYKYAMFCVINSEVSDIKRNVAEH